MIVMAFTDALYQHWMHSHEEDTDTEMMFRPAGFDFPLSRGRYSFELRPDGNLTITEIGPTDRPQETQGVWKVEGDDRIAFYLDDSPSEPSRVLQVISVDKDRMVLRK